jgi:hypothetical protein
MSGDCGAYLLAPGRIADADDSAVANGRMPMQRVLNLKR